MSMLSSTWALPVISRSVRPPVIWISRSASVDLPWSMWATMEQLRMWSSGGVINAFVRPRAPESLFWALRVAGRPLIAGRKDGRKRGLLGVNGSDAGLDGDQGP